MLKTLTNENFSSVVESDGLVILDFFAEWCGPCKMLLPIMDNLASEYTDVTMGKLNVEESRDIAMSYGIRNLPTVLFLKNGEVVDKFTGFTKKEAIVEKINANR